jgi:hypothetical protein
MTADSSAGAVSHLSTDWHSINWKAANETGRRLQARIVQRRKARGTRCKPCNTC